MKVYGAVLVALCAFNSALGFSTPNSLKSKSALKSSTFPNHVTERNYQYPPKGGPPNLVPHTHSERMSRPGSESSVGENSARQNSGRERYTEPFFASRERYTEPFFAGNWNVSPYVQDSTLTAANYMSNGVSVAPNPMAPTNLNSVTNTGRRNNRRGGDWSSNTNQDTTYASRPYSSDGVDDSRRSRRNRRGRGGDWNSPLNQDGYSSNGYSSNGYNGYSSNGYNGYSSNGYGYSNGYNGPYSNGYNGYSNGYNGYSPNGYNGYKDYSYNGYSTNGYSPNGYSSNGYNGYSNGYNGYSNRYNGYSNGYNGPYSNGYNGYSSNGFSPSGYNSNGYTTSNSYSPSYTSNGYSSNGYSSNTYSPTRYSTNDYSTNGYMSNGVTMDRNTMSESGRRRYREPVATGDRNARNVQQIWDSSTPTTVQGGSLRTWSFPSARSEFLQVMMKTDGRPLEANIELWQGPNNSPQQLRVYVEDGAERTFNAIFPCPSRESTSNTVAIRNTGALAFPLLASVDEDLGGLGPATASLPSRTQGQIIQGGSVRTIPFSTNVDSVQVALMTDGRPLNARVELLQGPNNNKQVMEIYCEDGRARPFFAVIETPGVGNVVRIVNTASVEFPLTAWVEPYMVGNMY
jgi:hypothetical protein